MHRNFITRSARHIQRQLRHGQPGGFARLLPATAVALAAIGVFGATAANAQLPPAETLFVAVPLTAPHSFTKGIEGPAVDRAGNIYAVNLARQQTIGKVAPDGVAQILVTLPGASIANGLRFASDGSLFAADYVEHTIYRIDMARPDAAPTVFAREPRMHQPNDIAITDGDVLYASDPDWKLKTGRIWRIDRSGAVTLVAEGLGTVNGIEVSPDGRRLFMNESDQQRIWSYAIGADGTLADKRLFKQFADFGLDGMRFDIDGNLYVTRYGKGTVLKLAPDGRELREIPVLGGQPSNISFGGPDGRTAYVTEVAQGRLVQFRVDRPGLEWQRSRGRTAKP